MAPGFCSLQGEDYQRVLSCWGGTKTTLPTKARGRAPLGLRHLFSQPMTTPGGSEAGAVRRQSGFFFFFFFFFSAEAERVLLAEAPYWKGQNSGDSE